MIVSTPIFPLNEAGLTPGYSGLECIAGQTAVGLAEKGHYVAIVAPDGSCCRNVTNIAVGPAGRVNEQMAYERYKNEIPKFDVIIDNSWMKFSYLAKAEGKTKISILGVFHAPIPSQYAVWPPHYNGLPPIQKACPVCISQDQANHFEAIHGTESRIAKNGIDTEHYKSIGCPRSERFLFLARFSSIKGADIAIESCLKAGVGLDLIGDTTITGEPDYLKKCMDMAEYWSEGWDHAKNGKQIRILGGVSRGECVWWMSQAKCFLHSTGMRFREPYGLAPVEAGACGNPVIAWNYGALRETVIHGKTGWLVKSNEEFVDVIKKVRNEGVSDQMRVDCRENIVSKCSVDIMCCRYEELCKEALDSGGW